MSNAILVDEIAGSLVVRFNRPEIRSPLSVAVIEELQSCIEKAAKRQVERLIFTGTGDVFASGADLREIARLESKNADEFARRGQQLMWQVSDFPAPSIAAINGICFGGALDLALACSARIAGKNALFAHPGADLGIITGWGGTQRLPRLIGPANALEMFFTAERVTATKALSIGLIDQIAHDPLTEALALNG